MGHDLSRVSLTLSVSIFASSDPKYSGTIHDVLDDYNGLSRKLSAHLHDRLKQTCEMFFLLSLSMLRSLNISSPAQLEA